jgi:hypothetical protein
VKKSRSWSDTIGFVVGLKISSSGSFLAPGGVREREVGSVGTGGTGVGKEGAGDLGRGGTGGSEEARGFHSVSMGID